MKRFWMNSKLVWESTPDKQVKLYNNTLPKRQQGGTIILVSPYILHHCTQSGRYHLVRCLWIEINNKNKKTIIISVYEVIESQYNEGMNTYYAQLRRLQINNNINKSPIELFWEDLNKFITSLHIEGKTVILGIDANSDLDNKKSEYQYYVNQQDL